MKTIGLLGGMSWESTVLYYQGLNRGIQQALGGLHSANIQMHSVNFAPLEAAMLRGDWDWIGETLLAAAQNLERAGADCVVIATNTMHRFAPMIQAGIHVPLLHIVDAVVTQLQKAKFKQAGLLGTQFSMESKWYPERLAANQIDMLVPDLAGRELINTVIFDELCLGQINPDSRQAYLDQIQALSARGADVVLLACTEIGMLVQQEHTEVPLLDTTECHIDSIVKWALA